MLVIEEAMARLVGRVHLRYANKVYSVHHKLYAEKNKGSLRDAPKMRIKIY